MNKACLKCGRIISVPDIPLPAGYTQKCQACGYDNPISDEFDAPPASPTKPPPPAPKLEEQPEVLDFSKMKDPLGLGINNPPKPPAQPKTPKAAPKTAPKKPSQEAAPLAPPSTAPVPSPQPKPGQPTEAKLAAGDRSQLELRLRALETAVAALSGPTIASPEQQIFEHERQKSVATNQLVLSTANAQIIKACEQSLNGQAYGLKVVPSLKEAMTALGSLPPEVWLIDQKLLAGNDAQRSRLQALRSLDPNLRRYLSLVLLSPSIATGESQVFFQWGFDLCIHFRDLTKLDKIMADFLELKKTTLAPYLQANAL